MNFRDRLAIIASLLVLPLAGMTVNAFAEAEESPNVICTKEADESGLTGTEREEYIKECVQNMDDGGNKN